MQRRREPVLGLLLLAVLFSSIAHGAPYRITVLATNIADYGGLGEWNFAALFESQQDAVLFDTFTVTTRAGYCCSENIFEVRTKMH